MKLFMKNTSFGWLIIAGFDKKLLKMIFHPFYLFVLNRGIIDNFRIIVFF